MGRKHVLRRMVALVLVCVLLAVPAMAASEEEPFRELLPPTPIELGMNWIETPITIRSNGNVLRGIMACPKNISDQMPVAILLHGLGTDLRWCDDIAWYLADRGIVSVRFDFNGSGRSDGAQEDMTVTSEVQDTVAILDYVKGLKFTDTDHIFMIGKSMGAVAAVMAARQRPGDVAAMCFWYPGFGIQDAANLGYFLGETYDPNDPPETLEIAGYTYGKAFLEDAKSLDYETAIREYDGPVLILHGDRDFIAPPIFSFWARDRFRDCTLHVVPGGFHGFFMEQELLSLEDTARFLREQLD